MARFGAGCRRPRCRRHADRHGSDRRDLPGVGDVCDGRRPAGHVRDQAARPGRQRSGNASRSATAPRSSSTPTSPTRCASRCRDASSATSPTSGTDFVLVLADMAPAVQGDQIAGCTPQEAQLAVEALAGLHGPSWCDPAWLGLSAISMPKPGDEAAAKGLGDVSVMAADITIDKLGARMSAEDRETLTAAMGLVTPWLLAEPKRFALMHGDYRLDNMLFDPDRTRITVVDWQTMGVGLPPGTWRISPRPAWRPRCDRRSRTTWSAGITRPLLGYGVTDYDADTCWRDYRLGVIQAPLITRARLRLRRIHRTRRRDDPDDASPWLPGDPGAGNAGPDQQLPVDLTHAAASSTVLTVATPGGSGGRSTITTATPSAAAASSLGRVIARRCSWSPTRRCGGRAARPVRRRSGMARATAPVGGGEARCPRRVR